MALENSEAFAAFCAARDLDLADCQRLIADARSLQPYHTGNVCFYGNNVHLALDSLETQERFPGNDWRTTGRFAFDDSADGEWVFEPSAR